ncbi:hypothetical protein O3M35_003405 [Rhynocoris fuscipes]|uniref:Uncharacterized protein n=1 Tax=Rhynocoris fuscipes TaxID=488301 RepID=A0AAW1CRG4_9HEMI
MNELESKICFMLQVKWHPCSVDVGKKLIMSKLSYIRMEYKQFLSCLQLFLRYSGHKIRSFEQFCWQHCWFD